MGTIVQDNGGDFEPIPLGMHRAICINVFDVGLQPGYQGGPAAKKVVVLWEIEARGETGKRFTVTKIYTQSINNKSNLGVDLVSWRTRPFTAEELKGFDLDNIKLKPCQVNLVPGGANGDKAKVAAVMPADKRAPYWTPETKADYIPNFVKKMFEQRLPEPVKQAGTQTVPAGDGFEDDIPF